MNEIVINVNQLRKQYGGDGVSAVNGISFEVREGEFFGFLGVNGAGKSTTIDILATLSEKSSGDVTICGHDIIKEADEVKKSIGVVFQEGVLDKELSVYDNLLYRGSLYGIEKKKLIIRIQNLVEKLSMKEFIKRPYGKLSGGQRRKSDIARALLSNPKVLFLDEPTTGLDPQSRVDLWKVIQSVKVEFKTTIFLTTHYMEEVNDADRIAIIDHGKILCIDTPENLKTEYSFDEVRLTVLAEEKENLEALLQEKGYSFKFVVDTFVILLKDGRAFIDDLPSVKSMISSFEVKKGDMNQVFLNIVGEGAKDE